MATRSGRRPEAVVDEVLGVFGDEAVADVHGFAIDDEGFEVAVGGETGWCRRGLVDAAGFHADEAVFQQYVTSYFVQLRIAMT